MKNNNILTIIISILLVLSLTYIGYDKLFNKDNNKCRKDSCNCPVLENNCENDASKIFYNNLENNRKTIIEDKDFEVIIDEDGNAYYGAEDIKITNPVGKKGSYKINGYISSFGENGPINILKGYKLDIKNVVMMYQHARGNGGYEDYIFIKNDGSVARLTYTADRDTIDIIEFKDNIPGLKNIVGIIPNNSIDAKEYKLVDINGNIFDNK